MQRDELRELWAAQAAALERSVAVNERLLKEMVRRKARTAMTPYLVWRALEVVVGVGALLLALPILATHVAEARYSVVGGALAVFAIVVTAQSAYLLVKSLQLDFGGSVTEIQRDIEHIRLVEYRALKWALLGGVVTWLPAGLFLFEAVTGVNALARVPLPWLAANLVFGLLVLAVGQSLSKKHVERRDLKPWARRLVDSLSGRAVRAAAAHIAELATFEREEPRVS